jgi:DNA polymerase III alpha subunit
MKVSKLGSNVYSEEDIISALSMNPTASLRSVLCDGAEQHNAKIEEFYLDLDRLLPEDTFEKMSDSEHEHLQSNWKMPGKYKDFAIAEWLLEQCDNDDELQRMGEELLLYHSMDLFDLLRYCKYLVDVCAENKIVLGVGRGSSVASFALYKIGLHRIDSLFYDLDIRDFLK